MRVKPARAALVAIATSSALLIVFGSLQFAFLGLMQAIAVCTLIERI